ncbi:MAG: hypothetical protein Q4C83_00155 [Candidatus Saccharibacteria bacterium]|nr:hypothetical protein [Candidatus Saccharibacteria bacterium]
MKELIKKAKLGIAMIASMALVASAFVAVPVNAACGDKLTLEGATSEECAKGEGQASSLFGDKGIVNTVINTMLFITGILSVIMIIYAGIRYVTAHGDKSQVTSAQNTLLYAIVGLVVSIVAYALVNWVTSLWN